MNYLLVRNVHIACVTLSGAGFFLRGMLMFLDSPLLQRRFLRVLPHLVDTLLLTSAVALAVGSGQYPFAQGWLTAKLLALFCYIGCGTMALKRGRTPAVRTTFFIAALLCFAYIVSVALARSPLGLFLVFN